MRYGEWRCSRKRAKVGTRMEGSVYGSQIDKKIIGTGWKIAIAFFYICRVNLFPFLI